MKAEYATCKVIKKVSLVIPAFAVPNVHVATLSNEFLFSAGCGEDVCYKR